MRELVQDEHPDIREDKRGLLIAPDGFLSGDYVGGIHNRANREEFVEVFESGEGVWWYTDSMGYGAERIVIAVPLIPDADADAVLAACEGMQSGTYMSYSAEDRDGQITTELLDEAVSPPHGHYYSAAVSYLHTQDYHVEDPEAFSEWLGQEELEAIPETGGIGIAPSAQEVLEQYDLRTVPGVVQD
jgi:hypothetical protein